MLYGYSRTSTVHQSDALQRRALVETGVDPANIFSDVITRASSVADRPGWGKLSERLSASDTVVVWRIDRLGRSVSDVLGNRSSTTGGGIPPQPEVEAVSTGSTPAT